MVAWPVGSVVPVMTRLAPLTVALRPAAAKPESALRAAAAAVRESGVEPRLTVAAGCSADGVAEGAGELRLSAEGRVKVLDAGTDAVGATVGGGGEWGRWWPRWWCRPG